MCNIMCINNIINDNNINDNVASNVILLMANNVY